MFYGVAAILYCPTMGWAMMAVPYNLDHYGIFNMNLETKFISDTGLTLSNSFLARDGFLIMM